MTKKLIWARSVVKFYMDINKSIHSIKLAKWVVNVVLLDVAVYLVSLYIFPDLWFNWRIFVSIAIGTIVSYLLYTHWLQSSDTAWKNLAEILVTLDVGLNAVFCIIISALMVAGVAIAAGAL